MHSLVIAGSRRARNLVCTPYLHSGQTTGHSREHACDLSISGHFPSLSNKISAVNLRHSSHLTTKFNYSAPTNVFFLSFTA